MWCLCFLGVITYWSTSSPSFLLGGITYNNGALTVPSDGVYYIYTHLCVKRSSGYAYPGIGVNGNSKLYLASYHAHGEQRSKHGALLQQLRKGDSVQIYGRGPQYYMEQRHAVFGMFKVQ